MRAGKTRRERRCGSLSIDNVVAAVALSPKLWIIVTGVFIGILILRFLAGYCIKLIERFPVLGKTAFLLVGYVGVLLCVELTMDHFHPEKHFEIGPLGKFIGIVIIVLATLIYDTQPLVKKVFGPLVRAVQLLMLGLSRVFEVIFWVPKKVFGAIHGVFRRPAAQLPPGVE